MSESTELQRAVENLTSSIQELRQELVRKDVYKSDQERVSDKIRALEAGVGAVGATVEKIEERRAADRRLLLTAFVLPLVLIILQVYIAAQVGPS
jgi:uncharacterized protein YukE